MTDARITNLADLLVNYCNKVEAKEQVQITGPVAAAPLLGAVYQQCLAAGAYPTYELTPPNVQEMLLKHGKKDQIQYLPEWKLEQARQINCMFHILGDTNTRELSGVDPKSQQKRLQGLRPLREILHQRMADESLRWCLTLFPTEAYAQDSEMSLSEFEDFVYSACKVDRKNPVAAWKRVKKSQDQLIQRIKNAKTIQVKAPGTDLSLSVSGRTWINCCGTENMPDGEIFTAPVEDSAEGTIRYSFPACHNGREVEDVQLTFKKGQVVEAKARKNQDYLEKMLDVDHGARYLGEFAFATNRDITRFTRNILFDEKIGGTIHLAVGSSYPEAGGINKSSLHWDMICDLRGGGEVLVDGKVFVKDGEFTNE